MNDRISALEKVAEKSADRLGKIEQDVAVIRANFAPKDDLAKVAQDVAIIRSNYSTKEDLHKELHTMTWKIYGAMVTLIAAAFFLARYVAPMPPQLTRPTASVIVEAPAATPAPPAPAPAAK